MKIIILLLFLSFIPTLHGKESQGKIIINDITKLVKQFNTTHAPQSLEKTLHKYIQLYKFDKSYYAYELIYPIYQKNRPLFNKVLAKLSKQEQSIIKLNIEGFQEEQTHGNDF